jgi:hypothetical protein
VAGFKAARVVLALLALSFASQPGPLMGQGGWRSYNVKYPDGLRGLDFTVRFPHEYVESDTAKPGDSKEFSIRGEGYVYYLSIDIFNLDEININNVYQDSNGNYINELLEIGWLGIVSQLDGAQSYSTGFLNNNPYCDVKIIKSQNSPYQAYDYMESRLIMRNNKIISLRCGDVMLDEKLNNHNNHNKNVCQPFFNSLTFNE